MRSNDIIPHVMVEMGLYSADPAWRLPGDVFVYLRSKYLYFKVAFK